MRNCLERLKEIVPLTTESARHTTLGLLTNAKDFIAVSRISHVPFGIVFPSKQKDDILERRTMA